VRGELALAEHIEGERDVARLGEPRRLFARVLVVAPPLVDDQHARPLAGLRLVPGEEPLEDGIALRVVDGFRPHLAGGGAGQRQASRHRHHRRSCSHRVWARVRWRDGSRQRRLDLSRASFQSALVKYFMVTSRQRYSAFIQSKDETCRDPRHP
jgi:hypothetical protein